MTSPQSSSRPPKRGDRRRARTRHALVEAARQVFASHGIEGATIHAIAEAADVAKGSFYNHFDSREEIAAAVVADTFERLGASLDAEVGPHQSDPARVVAVSLRDTLRLATEDPALAALLARAPEVMDVAERALAQRADRDLRRGLETGRFQFDDLDTVICAIAGGGVRIVSRCLRDELAEGAPSRFVSLALRMLGLDAEEANRIATEVEEGTT